MAVPLETGRAPTHLCLSSLKGLLTCKNKPRYPEHYMCLFFVWKSLEKFERYFFSTHNAGWVGGGVWGGEGCEPALPRFKVNRAALSASFIEPDPWNVTSSMGGAFLSSPVHSANKSALERIKQDGGMLREAQVHVDDGRSTSGP